jgi:hypothetical protein
MTAGQFDDIGDPAEKPGINTVNALHLQTSPWVPGAQSITSRSYKPERDRAVRWQRYRRRRRPLQLQP